MRLFLHLGARDGDLEERAALKCSHVGPVVSRWLAIASLGCFLRVSAHELWKFIHVQGRIQVPETVRCRVAAWPEVKSVRSLSGSTLEMTYQSS
jgi:hypothetical protein